jgi:hypothetical protein
MTRDCVILTLSSFCTGAPWGDTVLYDHYLFTRTSGGNASALCKSCYHPRMVLRFFGKRYRSFLEKLFKHCSNEGGLDGSAVQIGGEFFFIHLFLSGIITRNKIRISHSR